MERIFDLPLWVAGPALVALLTGGALAGLGFVRSRLLPHMRIGTHDSEFSGTLVQSVMVFYGLAVALIAVNVMETHSDASRIVSSEAAAAASLYRDAGGYPEPFRGRMQEDARRYLEYVIREEWPAQRRGRAPAVTGAGVDFYAALATFEPATEGQKIIHAETWQAFNRLVELRRQRIESVGTGLPPVMWLIVLLGAGISLTGTFFFHVEDVRLHRLLVTLLATFVALVIFVVFAMDRPFRGDLGITADAFQLVYDQVMRR